MERQIFNMLMESADPDIIVNKEFKRPTAGLWDVPEAEEVKPKKKKIEVIDNISEDKKKASDLKTDKLENEEPKAKDKSLKESISEDNEPPIDYFLYLAMNFNLKQFCDFYWIIANTQKNFQTFMPRENNSAFAKVYNSSIESFKHQGITFGAWKDTLNRELSKQVYPDKKEAITGIALQILLGYDKNQVYEVIEQYCVDKGVECGNYFAF